MVEAEGAEATEVAAPPAAPGADAPPADGSAAAPPAADPTADEGVAPPPIESYGPQIVPSLGTAIAPLTGEPSNFSAQAPVVMAPEVAGQPQAPAVVAPPADDGAALAAPGVQSGLLSVVDPSVRSTAAATLSIVQPSWFATATALVIMLAAASYGAVLRRRGQDVPEALAIATAIRPGDTAVRVARSIRPADIRLADARSIRP